MLNRTLEVTLLYDFYGSLLTERQRSIIELYHHQDLSLGEIAENHGVTRQAIHDILRRAEQALQGYEEALGLLAKHQQHCRLMERCKKLLAALQLNIKDNPEHQKLITQLEQLLEEDFYGV